MGLPGVLTTIGFLLLVHTTYGLIKHRELLKLMQETYQSLPTVLLAELALGTALAGLGGFLLAGSLKPAIMSKQSGSADQGSFRMDFTSFNTRARAFKFDIPTAK